MTPSPEPSGLNSGYVGQLLEQYLDNPEAVDPVWREFFEGAGDHVLHALPGLTRLVGRRSQDGGNGAPAPISPIVDERLPTETAAAGVEPAPPDEPSPVQEPAESRAAAATADSELLAGVAAAMSLVKAYRMHGHLNARLDPLGSEPMGDPALDETQLQPPLTRELQARIPSKLLRLSVPGDTLLEALPRLKAVYTGTIAYEIEHISDHAERLWLRQAIETGRFRGPLEPAARGALLARLAQVEAFETYLRRAFIGQKQFSLEGLDVLVPM
ncbi:MAG TPA: hypothetical protein VFU34_07670, partial [Gaiellaceae bacterium]|nr:hypothetical protein [Gaiellaceae bacterium]